MLRLATGMVRFAAGKMLVADIERTERIEAGDRTAGTVPTNQRLLSILEAIAAAGRPVTPTVVNAKLGLPKATIHRLFATLEALGFVERALDGRSYQTGRRLRRLSIDALSSQEDRIVRSAVLGGIAADIGETCNIAAPDRAAMVYIERVETEWPLRIQLPVGTHVPFHCTASGKMYLASLTPGVLARYLDAASLEARTARTITEPSRLAADIDACRHRGYAIDDGEFMDGMIALAVPIEDDKGRLLSTLSFHAPTQRLGLKEALGHERRLRDGAKALARIAIGVNAVSGHSAQET